MYSQGSEEQVLLEIFAIDGTGSVLDIGAANGQAFSNSLKLIELGWSGMLIEPSPTAFIALRELHGSNNRVRLVNAAVGLDAHLVQFFDSPDLVATTELAHREKWSKDAAFYSAHWVPQVTPAQLMNQFSEQFDLISIDTEGTSTDLFFAMMQAGFSPRAWVVEHDGRHIEIANAARERGWGSRYLDGNNIIVAR